MKKLVIASNNPGKLREIDRILSPLGMEVLPQSVFNIPEAEEPHCTFIENCLAKARHASELSGLPALADDSGICVDALNGAPGVYSARFAGEPKSDERNNAKLLESLAHEVNRKAHYYCVIVLVRHPHDPQPLIAEGIWEGEILHTPRGSGGFGYDPYFLVPGLDQTGAELSMDVKNAISHRGKALAELLIKLKLSSIE
ncbi:RdgB/HAM1 family non-canonical purine NTP pyrophosphatase [Sulfurirhabdus autotrophica]|uniref:dITP/XTP pyrophosphatase n=1 Tax=Sulfurirhabdus autotrophica TaxID=1706046 RepID=A0A4R3Y261_9PROT|nr:RdgB/HAM1 family non-canonical purine NTP pyrophosphatase [Sulfurirhabdus autotrophica]TCV84113.1 XTP/dITP diphosphohydrolase [Sulfurirhabdus autotrophica]